MKFSHSLQFNAVPEWSSKYINYDGLKRDIYQMQRDHTEDIAAAHDREHLAFTADNDPSNPVNVFTTELDNEVSKIDKFYRVKEKEIYRQYNVLLEELDDFDRHFPAKSTDDNDITAFRDLLAQVGPQNFHDNASSVATSFSERSASDTAKVLNSNSPLSRTMLSKDTFSHDAPNQPDAPPDEAENLRLTRQKSIAALFDDDDFNLTFAEALRVEKRKPLSEVFVRLSELKSYIELNRIGFGKACKKFDKVMYASIKEEYLASLPRKSYIFRPSTIDNVTHHIENVALIYSVFTGGNLNLAKDELRSNLREYVVWERNTVWRDMIGMERQSQAAHGQTNTRLGDSLDKEDEKFNIPLGAGHKLSVSKKVLSSNGFKIFLITVITYTLLRHSPFTDPPQRSCFAVLVCASMLWASEAIPLFTTSLLVPFLIVVFGVLKDPETGEVLPAIEASKYICSAMWSPIILLLLGGFTLAAALSKYNLDKIACTFLLSRVPQHPVPVLGAIMGVSALVAAFVSNVAAPVLMYSVVRPVLNTLPEGSSFAQALVVGIALASNVAGIISPIASPQNVVALQSMDPAPNWIQWFTVSLPVCITVLFLIFVILLVSFDFRGTTLVPIKSTDDRFTWPRLYVIIVSFITIVLWCITSLISDIVGDMGMIAIASMVAFYAPGILTTDDFNNYPWTIVMLAMGGLALGKGITVSGLLDTIAALFRAKLDGRDLFEVLALFGIVVTITATFVSHTVAALIIIPLIAEIGRSLPDPHPNLLVMAAAFLCSSGMALPTSGFPNVTAVGLRDSVGNPYVSVTTFMKNGSIASLCMYLVVISIGYLMMRLMNF